MKSLRRRSIWILPATLCLAFLVAHSQEKAKTSYMKLDITESFSSIFARLSAEKPAVAKDHMNVLNERYDLSNRPAAGVTMDRTKPLQEGVRVKLPAGMTWEKLASMTPDEISQQNLFPKGFYPLPHPKHSEGGMVFPNFQIEEIQKQEARDLTRFDCHVNGHTNKATHLAPDARPQEVRHRIVTPTLRGVSIQRLFGSQRCLRSIEDFTQFEQSGAYFDGDHVIAAKKGVNFLDRQTQVNFMAEFQEMLDFPPAPKLDLFGKLDPTKATPAELHGQEIFFGKGQCSNCHAAPYYTDNLTHDLHTERFFKPARINGMLAVGDGPIKTFPLRGIKDTPPYLHDGRLLTLEDAVEFFNLIDGTKLTPQEKKDLVAFLRAL